MIKQEISSEELAGWVTEGMLEKKGFEVVLMDMRGIHSRVADYFVICHASSVTQAEALAESVEEIVRVNTQMKPKHIEGLQQCEWILLDYFDVVAHIFVQPARSFYRLEDLWADAIITRINEPTK